MASDASGLDDLVVVDFDPSRSTDEVIATLMAVPQVADVTASGGFSIATTPNDPGFARQWGMVDVKAPQAWQLCAGDPSVVVAVVDTGCDLGHLDLAGQFAGPGTNTITPGASAQDDHGHGTHVAGIVAAIGDNALDVAGMAWRTRVLPVKVLDSGGRAVGPSIAQGIAWAASRCSVINLSLQGPVDDLAVRTAIDSARSLGVVVVAAMGNFGWDEKRPSYPAAYARTHDNVLAVGAVDPQHKRSVWGPGSSSNTGSWIGISAPGTNIDSLKTGGGVTRRSGTSQASPHVAGAAALVRATLQAGAADVVRMLTSTAGALTDAAGDPVPNAAYGFGLLDVEAAVRAAAAAAAVPAAQPAPVADKLQPVPQSASVPASVASASDDGSDARQRLAELATLVLELLGERPAAATTRATPPSSAPPRARAGAGRR